MPAGGNQDQSKLTEKQKLFADEYLIDLNATAAYKRAGYVAEGNSAEVNASRLLSNAKVATYIQERMDKRAAKVQVDAEYVLKTIVETVERCRQVYPVLDRKGEQVYVRVGDGDDAELKPAFTFEANSVLKGAELLGRHLKMFTDKVEQTGKDGGAIQVDVNIKPEEAYLKMIGKV